MALGDQNDTVVETSTLTHDDLQDAYEKLAEKYVNLKKENDCLNQKLHQEISQRKVIENTLNDVQSELDSINEINDKRFRDLEKKNEELKVTNQSLKDDKTMLEGQIDDLIDALDRIKEELKEAKGLLAVRAIKPRVSNTFARSLEIENENLRATVIELKEQIQQLTEQYSECTSRLEELTESNLCLKDNLETKKFELLEKIEMVDHLNEKVHELSTELTLLKNSDSSDDTNRKGNSLFAEVDDQRQKMKMILKGERQHYLEMKKAYNSKEMEIRRLKRENLNIKSEIQACTNQLLRGEKLSKDQMRTYISSLEINKQNLEKELKQMQQNLIDLAGEQKMHWVETVLTASSKEAREMKDKFYVLLREQTNLTDAHHKALKELAKVRLDGIKLKVLLGRIVYDYKLKINESQYDDLDVDETVFENLKLEDCEAFEPNEINDEKVDKPDDSSAMLNESTIILLGGRERLGNAIPNVQKPTKNFLDKMPVEKDFERTGLASRTMKVELKSDDTFEFEKASVKLENAKENLPAAANKSSPPEVAIKIEVQSTLKIPASVNKNSLEAKNPIKAEPTQSLSGSQQQQQKKPMFTVKRIVIPSKIKPA